MKIRSGFVSNSSSSSFICEVCGRDESDYDLSLNDAGMVECKNGHVFCPSHAKVDLENNIDVAKEYVISQINTSWGLRDQNGNKLSKDDFIKMSDDQIMELAYGDPYDGLNSGYDIPTKFCPICNLEHIRSKDVVAYIEKLTDHNLAEEIRSKFNNLSKLKQFIEGGDSHG